MPTPCQAPGQTDIKNAFPLQGFLAQWRRANMSTERRTKAQGVEAQNRERSGEALLEKQVNVYAP